MSAEFIIRPFRAADREAVIALWSRVFAGDPPWNAPEAMIDRKLAVQPELSVHTVVGETQGQVVGTVLAGFDGVRGWLHHLPSRPNSGGAASAHGWCARPRKACGGWAARK